MTAPVIISRVRATLHKLGYQGFTQQQIIEAANFLTVDINNPSPENTKAVANYLIQLSSVIFIFFSNFTKVTLSSSVQKTF